MRGQWLDRLRPNRYGPIARWYDVVSFERPMYRAGRVAAIAGLELTSGARVLDVGCGTGLNLPLLVAAVGPTGTVVGLDSSREMLAQARARVQRAGWTSVHLVRGDAAGAAALVRPLLPGPDAMVDVVLFTYSLGVIAGWEDAWDQSLSLLRPGGRVAVVDTAYPTRRWSVSTPLAGLAMLAGGVHPGRRVWERVAERTVLTHSCELRGGHVRVAVGTSVVRGTV